MSQKRQPPPLLSHLQLTIQLSELFRGLNYWNNINLFFLMKFQPQKMFYLYTAILQFLIYMCKITSDRTHGQQWSSYRKLYCSKSNLNVRSHFFSQRCITACNSLWNEVATSPSISIFNSRIHNVNFEKYLII